MISLNVCLTANREPLRESLLTEASPSKTRHSATFIVDQVLPYVLEIVQDIFTATVGEVLPLSPYIEDTGFQRAEDISKDHLIHGQVRA